MDQYKEFTEKLLPLFPGAVSPAGDPGYVQATALWAKSVIHCSNTKQVQLAVIAARDAALPLSVRGAVMTGPGVPFAAASS
jgi:FAD/FMN-containing dehydrogenase